MRDKIYPTYDLEQLIANKLNNAVFSIDSLSQYSTKNPCVRVVHSHNFYHLVLFTKGRGNHIIDFQNYSIQPGMIYFMRPGQVHQWEFDSGAEGYVLNFSQTFFDQHTISSSVLDKFSFFTFMAQHVFILDSETEKEASGIFDSIYRESKKEQQLKPLYLAALLLQLFIIIERSAGSDHSSPTVHMHYNYTLYTNFLKMIEDHYDELKLPREYAELLYVTPKYLNTVSKEFSGFTSGELIRNRIVLEAKRLLVNSDLSISEIASCLHFYDNSYFVKFFKKNTGLTPENFRKAY